MTKTPTLIALCLSALLASATPEDPPDSGALVVIGGGGIPDDVRRKALDLAGGEEARVVILPQASGQKGRGQEARKRFAKIGAGRVEVVEFKNWKAAAEAILGADLIWLGGGSQNRLMKALRDARLEAVVREAHAAGAVVGGSSAGAAVMSRFMITGDDYDLKSLEAGKTHVADGLGLWPDVIVDQHFLARQRNQRLLTAVLDHPVLLGIGIDESTAVVVRGDEFEVVGESNVVVYDARQAKVEETEAGAKPAATGLRLHILRPGMRFTLSD